MQTLVWIFLFNSQKLNTYVIRYPGVVRLRRAHGARGGRAGAVGAAARARAQLQRDTARRAAVQGAERRHARARLSHCRGGG